MRFRMTGPRSRVGQFAFLGRGLFGPVSSPKPSLCRRGVSRVQEVAPILRPGVLRSVGEGLREKFHIPEVEGVRRAARGLLWFARNEYGPGTTLLTWRLAQSFDAVRSALGLSQSRCSRIGR